MKARYLEQAVAALKSYKEKLYEIQSDKKTQSP